MFFLFRLLYDVIQIKTTISDIIKFNWWISRPHTTSYVPPTVSLTKTICSREFLVCPTPCLSVKPPTLPPIPNRLFGYLHSKSKGGPVGNMRNYFFLPTMSRKTSYKRTKIIFMQRSPFKITSNLHRKYKNKNNINYIKLKLPILSLSRSWMV